IQVAWNNIPSPTATDWLGLYSAGASDGAYLGWAYVSCSTTPTIAHASGSCTVRMPSLAAGAYEVRLFANDGFVRLGTTPLTLLSGAAQGASIAAPTARTSTSSRRPGALLDA